MTKTTITKANTKDTGGATSYFINGQRVPRYRAVRNPPEGFHVVTVEGIEYLRSNPNSPVSNIKR